MTSSFLANKIFYLQNLLDSIDEEFNASTILESAVITIEFLLMINSSLSFIAHEIKVLNFSSLKVLPIIVKTTKTYTN